MMKRFMAVVLMLVFVFGFAGCQGKTYKMPWDQFCFTAESPREVVLSGKDKEFIIDLMNGATWIEDMTNCGCDFIFYTQKQEVRYHSECGTFVDYTAKRSATLTEEQKNAVNAILQVDAEEENKAVLPFSAEEVEAIEVSTLPENDAFARTISSPEEIEKIIKYIGGMQLETDFPENPIEYTGMTVVMGFRCKDGGVVEVYSFGNMFLKVEGEPWLRMEYEEANELERMVLPLNEEVPTIQVPYEIPYVENEDGTFLCNGVTYKYRIEKKIVFGSGIQHEVVSLYLSNTEELPTDFSVEEAILVEVYETVSGQ